MSRDALPYPPQMRNGGSPPAHLSSSNLSDPSWWLHLKWSQPPPRAPEWLFDFYEHYNPSPLFGQPPRDENWHQRAIREDQQAAGLLPPRPAGGPILIGFPARADRAYRDWKRTIDELWADEYHRLCLVEAQADRARREEAAARAWEEAAARARREEAAARACREEANARARREAAARASEAVLAARRQQLADEMIDRSRREAAARAREEADARARREEAAARAQQEEAAARARQEEASRRQQLINEAGRTIFLWLHRRRIHVRLTRQTARRQHREAALARLRHEEACLKRAEEKRHEDALAEDERRRHAAAVRAMESAALALVEERRRQDAVLAAEADECRRHEAVFAAEADE